MKKVLIISVIVIAVVVIILLYKIHRKHKENVDTEMVVISTQINDKIHIASALGVQGVARPPIIRATSNDRPSISGGSSTFSTSDEGLNSILY